MKSQIAGWFITIAFSVVGAWATMNARMYEVEKRIEIVQLQIETEREALTQNQNDVKDIKELFLKIDKSITEINGKLQLKEDKKWR
ncbi:MAG: hypothetical protein H6Q12_15 [Bacteroidetes bacterium]|nr:hypothetical protein [Bacteroidota bacterium]